MKLVGEINLGRKVTGIRKIIKKGESNSLVYITQHGSLGVVASLTKKNEMIIELGLDAMSMKLPWQSGLSPYHGSYYSQNIHNNGWRKIARKPKQNMSLYNDLILFQELPLFMQLKLVSGLGVSINDFKNIISTL